MIDSTPFQNIAAPCPSKMDVRPTGTVEMPSVCRAGGAGCSQAARASAPVRRCAPRASRGRRHRPGQ
eukprot:7268248-Prymnesium_polylepis.1